MSVGVVVLSKASTQELASLTEQTLTSLAEAATRTVLDVVVLEQSSRRWPLVMTVPLLDEFNFNRFANIGANRVIGDHLLICNNDLRFHPDAIDILHRYAIQHDAPVVCPVCPLNQKQADLTEPEIGTVVARHFTGWCFMIHRDAWRAIGGFDEAFPFWFADNATVEQLKRANLPITVVPEARVSHHASSTLKTLRRPERLRLTRQQQAKFEAKYGPLSSTPAQTIPVLENG